MNERRTILEKVATGDLSPEEAADLLAQGQRTEVHGEASEPVADARTPVGRVRVIGAFRTAKVTGDPGVDTVAVEGEHRIERDGDTLLIRAEGYEAGEVDRGQFRFSSKDRTRVMIGIGAKPFPLRVRMNPDLPLDVEMAAGSLRVEGVRAPIKAEVSAGAVRIAGFSSPLDITVAGGSVSASGKLDHGDSRIRCEAGAVKVKLDEGSSVRLLARAGLGKVELPGENAGFIVGSGQRESVVGSGEGSLEIDVSMGKVSVT